MSKPTCTIIGAGVAGIVAAHYLQNDYEVTVCESQPSIGGHTNTVDVLTSSGKEIQVDTGFIVCNDKNYPCFLSFLKDLNVPTQKSDMSFSYYNAMDNFYWGSDFPKGVFAKWRHVIDPSYYQFLSEIMRFNTLAKNEFNQLNEDETLKSWLDRHSISSQCVSSYIIPMGAAIWSCAYDEIQQFPAKSFIQFWINHGLLTLFNRPQWYTVKGGSRSYIEAFKQSFKGTIETNSIITNVAQRDQSVHIEKSDGQVIKSDKVILACHADQALKLLKNPSQNHLDCLKPWRYSSNKVVLHTDTSLLPPKRSLWCSWNYLHNELNDNAAPLTVTYYMNRLQQLKCDDPISVTLNPNQEIKQENVIREIQYTHPIYDQPALRSQQKLHTLNHETSLLFCGSYFGYGFHEDAVKSSLKVVNKLKTNA